MRPLTTITRDEAHAKGLKRYFDGKPCKHGHIAERYVANAGCIMCVNRASPNRGPRAVNLGWPTRGLIFNVQPAPKPEEIEAAFRMIESNGWHDWCVVEMRKNPALLLQYVIPAEPSEQLRLMRELERQERIRLANIAMLNGRGMDIGDPVAPDSDIPDSIKNL
jgi:hypothetical protein